MSVLDTKRAWKKGALYVEDIKGSMGVIGFEVITEERIWSIAMRNH